MLGTYAVLKMAFIMLAIHVFLPIGMLMAALYTRWGTDWNYQQLDTVMLDIP